MATSPTTPLPPHPTPSFECQLEPGLEALHEAEPGARACGYPIPSVHPVPLPSVCLWCLLSVSSVPLGGLLAGPGSSLTRDSNPSFPPSIPPSLLRSLYHLSLPLLAFIFIFFFLFFLCAPSRGAVTEEKGPATWE